ncbi:MAG: M48 family metalloprotease [Alphaproteobacteria bacterium]|nr:M48 family metalloprotease [Alphaproteobacteria bacterium]
MIGARNFAPLVAVLLLAACVAPPPPVADLKPGERPDINSDEAGLWMQMDQVEEMLKTSGHVVEDRKLNDYIRSVTCKLSAEYCQHLRLFVVQTPHFNASMAPNGTMQVWTGTLLRAQNEAQLAYILGHEMAHYIRRHSVQKWRSIRRTTDSMAFMGDLAQIVAMTSVLAFSRDHERESDDIGFDLMVKAGYDPAEAPKTWRALLAERDADGEEKDKPSVFFSSHPAVEERVETLDAKAAPLAGQGIVGDKPYVNAVKRHRRAWLKDEMRKRDFAGTQVVLANLAAAGHPAGDIKFFEGELYRLRGDEGDLKEAIVAYRSAIKAKGAPVEVHRSLGLAYWKTRQNKLARKSFSRYLAAAPKAEDRAMIQSYIDQLK